MRFYDNGNGKQVLQLRSASIEEVVEDEVEYEGYVAVICRGEGDTGVYLGREDLIRLALKALKLAS
jgi:hypothetical protein